MTIAPLLAQMRLKRYLKGEPAQPNARHLPQDLADAVFIERELLPVTGYQPDMGALPGSHVSYMDHAAAWAAALRTLFFDE